MIRIIKNIFITLLSFFAFMLFMEAFIRFSGIESLSNFEVDSLHGKRLRQGIDLCYFNEGFYLGETNEYGYLGPSYSPQKNENTFRIALAGDSYVEAFQLFDRNNFRSLLETKLNIPNSIKYEIMNFGRSGFALSDMFVYSQNFIRDFQPDLILVFLHNEDYYTTSYQTLLPSLKIENEKLITNYDFINSNSYKKYQSTKFFRENSCIVRMINNGFKLYKENLHWKIILAKLYPFKTQKQLSDTIDNVIDKQIVDINKRIIKEWADFSNTCIVLCEQPDAKINQLIQAAGINTIDIYNSLDRSNQAGINTNYWPATGSNGHWNHIGHKIIAETLANWIENNPQIITEAKAKVK